MTNREKYKEVFGFNPDETCAAAECAECPCRTDGIHCSSVSEWWSSEYKGAAKKIGAKIAARKDKEHERSTGHH